MSIIDRSSKAKPQIIIIGANFAGIEAAKHLPRSYKVTVIDPNPFFEFLPNIHELISGFKTPNQLRFSKERIIKKCGHKYFQDQVLEIDTHQKKIITSASVKFSYDICILAIGSVNNTFGVLGADRFSMPFKSVQDCNDIGIRLQKLSERQDYFSISIVGGGLEGIEALGEILRFTKQKLDGRINIVDSKMQLLPAAPKTLDEQIRKTCVSLPVEFHMGASVKEVKQNQLVLASGETIDSDIIVWTGGGKAPTLLETAGLKRKSDVWAPVKDNLQSKYFDNIYVAGDAAETDPPNSKQAYHAMDMGKHVAKNIVRSNSNKDLIPFQPSGKPTLLSFGNLNTFMIFENRFLAGPVFSNAKEAVYQIVMAQYDPSWKPIKFTKIGLRASMGGYYQILPYLKSLDEAKKLSKIDFK